MRRCLVAANSGHRHTVLLALTVAALARDSDDGAACGLYALATTAAYRRRH